MIEKETIQYLSSNLVAPVYMGEKPINKPTEYIVVKTMDVGCSDCINAITFSIMSYSTSLLKASELNEEVKEAMFGIIGTYDISSCKLGGGSQEIDTETKEYAYESIFNLYY